jgi:hypothetical protein
MSRKRTEPRPSSARSVRGLASSLWMRQRVTPSVMPETELTEEMIITVMAKADARICVGSDRCYAFPDRLEDARESCTPKGRCKVGWIVSKGGRESFDVWLEVSTGLVKLIARVDA